jgi:hypothetical protein
MAHIYDINTGGFSMSNTQPVNSLDIYYQNVRGLRTKQLELYDNVWSTDHNIIRLTDTWLNDMCYDHNLFPDGHTVFHSDRVCTNKSRGGGVLIALSPRVRSCKRRCDLESLEECVWVEIPTNDGLNLLIGNHYFSPDTKPEVITNYFRFLETNLDSQHFRVFPMGDFNTPRFDWMRGLSQANCHYYSKLRGDTIYTSTCLLDLTQRIDAAGSGSLLDLEFTNFSELYINFIDSGIIKTDAYHPPFVIDVFLPFDASTRNCECSHSKFASGDYTLLYNILSTYDWSFMYSITSVDDAVTSLNAVVLNAMDQAIPRGSIRKSKFPHWFSSALQYYIWKKDYYYRRFKKKNSDYFYSKFSFYRKLVKATIKSDRLRWLRSTDDNLKSQSKQFWKYVTS